MHHIHVFQFFFLCERELHRYLTSRNVWDHTFGKDSSTSRTYERSKETEYQ